MADLKLTTPGGDEITFVHEMGWVGGRTVLGKRLKIVKRPDPTDRFTPRERQTFDIWLDESSCEALVYMLNSSDY